MTSAFSRKTADRLHGERMQRRVWLWVVLMMVGGAGNAWADPARARSLPLDDLGDWVVEQQPGGRVIAGGDYLEIDDEGGCTVWWRERLQAPVEITYTATVIDAGGPNDRVSDLNCFWMASDPRDPKNLFYAGHGRTGTFADYDRLRTYYVGYGGHTNTRTRFRRYLGEGEKPLLPEHDLSAAQFLIEPNRPYQIRLVARPDGTVRFFRDGELVFDYRDPEPLTSGWFGFRTVKNHLRIENVRVQSAP